MRPAVVILAAGRGKRMNSSMPKVLHRICNRPMLRHVVDAASMLKPSRIVVVTGRSASGGEEIKKSISGKNISFVIQKEPKGTGDALSRARAALEGFKGTVLVLNGDVPLITAQTLGRFLGLHKKARNDISLISFISQNPAAYGRILRDKTKNILSVIEEKDATAAQKKIKEVNSGIYAIESDALVLLKDIPLNTAKREYYLTDIIGISRDKGYRVKAYRIGSEEEMRGVNTISELLISQQALRKRLINRWIEKGVVFLDPDSVFVHPEVIIGKRTTVYPGVYLEGKTIIGGKCTIYPNVRIVDSVIKDSAVIKDSTVIESSIIGAMAAVGPFAHIRPGCDIGSAAKIGNFVEIKKSVIGDGSKASHLSYLGDASIGRNVNIGAGTITCNYDGKEKHKTVIEDNVFIGSDTQLIAPVRIGRAAYVGAGSTITKCVPPMSLAVSRAEQRNIKGWATKKLKVSKGQRVKGSKL